MVIVYNDYELILNILTIYVAQKLQDHIIAITYNNGKITKLRNLKLLNESVIGTRIRILIIIYSPD